MRTIFTIFILCFVSVSLLAQAQNNIYELYSSDSLLTDNVKSIISKNIAGKQVVFLGEAVHYSGSDMLAKTEFVKYLVTQHGFTEIAFESDFFALLFSHNKQNVYTMWSRSEQCASLWDFIKQNNINIWGFDNQTKAYYTRTEFSQKLS